MDQDTPPPALDTRDDQINILHSRILSKLLYNIGKTPGRASASRIGSIRPRLPIASKNSRPIRNSSDK